jgi:hypothetical protein
VASPFAVFRRNQKIMLAVVGVAAMVAFVVFDPLMRYVGGSSRGKAENPVVVETRFGDLRASELQALRYQRTLVEQFLMRVTQQAVLKQFGQANIDSRWLTGAVQQQFAMWHGQIMQRSATGPEEAAVETMVLAERAKQMGLVISDQSINDMIKQLSANSLSAEELQQIIHTLQPQRPISVAKLFDALRTELLAAQYMQFFTQSLTDIPPAQRFEYYSRLNRRAKTEVMALAVADFVDQVPDPSDAELKAFYEKYKDQESDPTSPDPGFKEPKRATFQYFKAALDPLTEKLKDEVTEEEIKKYYDENKRNFPAMSLDSSAKPGEESAAGEKPAESAPAGEKPADAKPEEKPADAPAAEEKPAEPQAAPAEEKPTEPAPSEEKPAEEKPAETPAATEEKPAEEAPLETPQTSLQRDRSQRGAGQTFRLVSTAALQEEGEAQEAGPALGDAAQAASDPPAEEKAAEEKPAETQPAPEQPAEAAPPASAPAAEAPAEAKTPTDAPAAEKPVAEKPAEEKPADPGDEVVKEPPVPEAQQFEPFEKVRDEIREMLARDKASQRLNEQFEELSATMRRFTDDYDVYTTDKGINPKAVAPVPLNFAELAKGKDVESFELKSATPLQAAKEDIGKSFRAIQNPSGGPGRTVPFIDFAYADTLPEYKPEVDQDAENNFYLFWKTQEEPAYVPPLDEVREKVVRAWKMDKARELAKKRGEEYAAQARALKKPLKDAFGSQANLKVADTAPFSWMTLGNVPTQPGAAPRLSEVDGVDQAGPEFMKTVFGLPVGGLGVALNEPQDTAYVVQVLDFEPAQVQLRDDFAMENPNRYMAAARDDQIAIFRDWIADLNKEAGVHWLRPADVRTANENTAEEEF